MVLETDERIHVAGGTDHRVLVLESRGSFDADPKGDVWFRLVGGFTIEA
jgi:hypothetical protein